MARLMQPGGRDMDYFISLYLNNITTRMFIIQDTFGGPSTISPVAWAAQIWAGDAYGDNNAGIWQLFN